MAGTIHGENIEVGGLDVHYLTGGRGEPLIVVHGGGEGAVAWLNNIEELTENYTVYVPDLPGFGGSEPYEGECYIPELVEFVDGFSEKLGLSKFHLMGHSLGGGIVLNYAVKFPHKITKLVLVSSLCLGKEIAFWIRFLTRRVFCRFLGNSILAVFRGVRWLAKKLFSNLVIRERLSELMMPTLVVWGAKDPVVPFRQAYAASRIIPDCQVKVFADCGHSVYRENLPEFSRLLKKFLG